MRSLEGTRSSALLAFALTALLCAGNAYPASWFERLRESLLGPAQESTPGTSQLTSQDIGRGLKEALRVSTEHVVAQLGTTDGFNLDPQIHIPLPDELDRVKSALDQVGMASTLEDLETRLNRAAETATPKAKALFLAAIQEMTLDDVMGVYHGPDDAATQYFRTHMETPLAAEMAPIVDGALAEVGVVETYDAAMQQYNALPFVPKINADLRQYVVDRSIDGIFFYVAQEEAAIRKDPAKRTTELLERVFSGAPGG